jgi:hypothetical protein
MCVFFLVAKGLNAKDIHKEIFPVYGGECLLRKAVHNWDEKPGKYFADDEEVEMEVRKWLTKVAETTVKRILCCGFRRTGKVMVQVYQCWWRICREINVFFQVRISPVLRFISICNIFTDSSLY